MLIAGIALGSLTNKVLAQKESPWKIAIMIRGLYADFSAAMYNSAIDECQKHLVEIVGMNARTDPVLQLDQIDTVIILGVDAVVLVAQDTKTIVPGIKKLNEQGIPVIAMDSPPSGGHCDLVVIFSCVEAGEKLGKNLVQFLEEKYGKPKGLILEVLGNLAHQPTHTRSQGFHNIVDEYPDIEVIQKVANWHAEEAFAITTDILTARGDELDAIYTLSDLHLPGIIPAMEKTGYMYPRGDPKHIAIASIDAEPCGLKAFREGKIDWIAVQPCIDYGRIAVQWAIRILEGEKVPPAGTVIEKPGEIVSPYRFEETPVGKALYLSTPIIPNDVGPDDPRVWGVVVEKMEQKR